MGNIIFWVLTTLLLIAGIFWLNRFKPKPEDAEPDLDQLEGAKNEFSFSNFVSPLRRPLQVTLGLGFCFNLLSTSFFYVGELETGHVVKRFMGSELPQGKIIATDGENGPQAEIYGPGLHFVPLITLYSDVRTLPAVEIPAGYYGLVTALDGKKLPEDVVIAPPLSGTSIAPTAAVEGGAQVANLFNAGEFLDPESGGFQGMQATVLKPGVHRMNLYLYSVDVVGQSGQGYRYNRSGKNNVENRTPTTITQIPTGFVGVVKSNIQESWRTNEQCRFGQKEADLGDIQSVLVPDGCKGVWQTTFEPGAYFFNSEVYDVTQIETRAVRWTYRGGFERCTIDLTVDAAGQFSQNRKCAMEAYNPETDADNAITVKVEGWDIPVELRVLVQVRPEDAPPVVAAVGSIEQIEDRIVSPAIRSIVRNIGGGSYLAPKLDDTGAMILDEEGDPILVRRPARALDFQDYRVYLEAAFEKVIMEEAAKAGISILEVKIGEPSIPAELLVARRREQLSEQLERSFIREQAAQEQRIKAENAKARAEQQPDLVQAEIDLEASERRKQARQNDGEGEKNYLTQVAEGQKAQALVLGEDRVLQLQALQQILAALQENPELTNIVPDPQVLVIGSGGAENATAIGAGLLADKLGGLMTPAQ